MNETHPDHFIEKIDSLNYKNDGVQLLRNVISIRAVNRVKAILLKSLSNNYEKLSGMGFCKNGVLDNNAISNALYNKDVNFDHETRMLLTGQFPKKVRLDKEIINLASERGLIKAINNCTGLRVDKLHMPPMARFVTPGHSNAAVPPHQDSSYNKHMSNFVTVWIPLVNITKTCGGVSVYPGVKEEVEITQTTKNGQWFEALNTKNISSVDCVPMGAGDALVMNKNTIHRSMLNMSKITRISLDLRYIPEESYSTKHYLNLNSMETIKPETE